MATTVQSNVDRSLWNVSDPETMKVFFKAASFGPRGITHYVERGRAKRFVRMREGREVQEEPLEKFLDSAAHDIAVAMSKTEYVAIGQGEVVDERSAKPSLITVVQPGVGVGAETWWDWSGHFYIGRAVSSA
jgi:hypothetical protein